MNHVERKFMIILLVGMFVMIWINEMVIYKLLPGEFLAQLGSLYSVHLNVLDKITNMQKLAIVSSW